MRQCIGCPKQPDRLAVAIGVMVDFEPAVVWMCCRFKHVGKATGLIFRSWLELLLLSAPQRSSRLINAPQCSSLLQAIDPAADCSLPCEPTPQYSRVNQRLQNGDNQREINKPIPVSYTHLTLPTIYSV